MAATRGPAALWLVRHAESKGNVADAQATGAGAARLELDVRDPDTPSRPPATSRPEPWARGWGAGRR